MVFHPASIIQYTVSQSFAGVISMKGA